jgi:hypothetical protein
MKNSEVGSPGLGQVVLEKNERTTVFFTTNTPILQYSNTPELICRLGPEA